MGFTQLISPILDLVKLPVPILTYVGAVSKRLIEPWIVKYELNQQAKAEQQLLAQYPHKRLEYVLSFAEKHPQLFPEIASEQISNLLKIADYTQGFFIGDKNYTEEKIQGLEFKEDEWLNRFIDNAAYVSDEELQKIWARLLKERICRPQNVNKRVLRFLSETDSCELQEIGETLAYFKMGFLHSAYVRDGSDFSDKLIRLMQLGLVAILYSPDRSMQIVRELTISPQNPILDFEHCKYIIKGLKNEHKMEFTSYSLSPEGEVLLNLIELPLPQSVIDSFIKLVKDKLHHQYEIIVEQKS